MSCFPSTYKRDKASLSSFKLAPSLSLLLLAFGLIASVATVLTKGSVLSDTTSRHHMWVRTTAIDTSGAGTMIRPSQGLAERSWATLTPYALLSGLLLGLCFSLFPLFCAMSKRRNTKCTTMRKPVLEAYERAPQQQAGTEGIAGGAESRGVSNFPAFFTLCRFLAFSALLSASKPRAPGGPLAEERAQR